MTENIPDEERDDTDIRAEAERLYANNPNYWGQKAGFIAGARWESGRRVSPVTREALIEFTHSRNRFDYDECQHGTYIGGPSNGEPYAMCERQGAALFEFLSTRASAEVTDDMVERAAEAIKASSLYSATTDIRTCRSYARAALKAALGGGGEHAE